MNHSVFEFVVPGFPPTDASWSYRSCFKVTAILPESSLHCSEFDFCFHLYKYFIYVQLCKRWQYESLLWLKLSLSLSPLIFILQLEACAHPFFDELRESNTRLPNGHPLPPLFNFKQEVLPLTAGVSCLNLLKCFFLKKIISSFLRNVWRNFRLVRDVSSIFLRSFDFFIY